MPVRFFELLGPVLSDRIAFVAEHEGRTHEEVYQTILTEAARNHAEWFSNQVPNLNYQETPCRLAYIYIVAAANANTFKSILTTDVGLRDYVLEVARARRQLRVCAFGAGPGTELMAFAKWFEEQQLGYCVQLDFQLLDNVQEWQDTWYGIRDQINSHFRNHYEVDFARWPLLPAGNFVCQDVKDATCMGRLGQVWNQDLYVVNFLLSEIFHDDPAFRAFMAEVTRRAPRGSRFVFIERRGGMWETRMAAIARDAGLRLSQFIESRAENLDPDENPALLGEIYRRLSDPFREGRSPRSSWNVVYSIGIKE